jgi:hypothetical protein
VYSLLVSGRTLYVGGAFGQIGGQSRQSLAALDLDTAAATAWQPALTKWDLAYPYVRTLAARDSLVFVGGDFSAVGGESRICLAAIDTVSGMPSQWDPGLDGLVWSLASQDRSLIVGGGFSRAGGLPSSGLASFIVSGSSSPQPPRSEPLQCVPNPAQTSAEIRFLLPNPAPVTLAIYDVQGRQIRRLLDRAPEQAGPHSVRIQVGSWAPGVYLCRLDGGGRVTTQKIAVVR